MKPRHPCLLAFLLAAPLCAAGQTVSLNTGGKQVRITIGASATLPADFPPDVALPDGHALTQVKRSGTTTVIELDAPGELEAVAARFRERMQANGWTAVAIAQPAAGRAQAWEKDARAVVAWLAPADAGVRLQLQLLPRH
jgi:ligand-binding sensor domain-containing protein